MSRQSLVLLFALVLVAVPSTKSLPTGAGAEDPVSGVWNPVFLDEEGTEQGNDNPTAEEDLEEAGVNGVERLIETEEGVYCTGEDGNTEEVEADVERDGKKNQENVQNSEDGSDPAEGNDDIVELQFFKREVEDSSEKSSNEEETETSSVTSEDLDSKDERRVEVSVKSRSEMLDSSESESETSPEQNEDSTDSPPEKRDTELLSDRSSEEENYEIRVQAEAIAEDINEDSETSDLEIAQSELNEIIFGEEAESAEEDNTLEGLEVSEADDIQNEEVVREEASAGHHTEESSVQKRTASVEELSEDGEVVATDKPRIRSPAEFFGHFEQDDSESIIGEEA